MSEPGLQESESSPKEVDRHDEKITKGIESAPVYKKQGEVRAQIAKGGEFVVTKLADGTTKLNLSVNE